MDRARSIKGAGYEVRVSAGPVTLEGNLGVPAGARGVVLFAHGSGSGRHSPATASSPGCYAMPA
jgi:hypothetical protein